MARSSRKKSFFSGITYANVVAYIQEHRVLAAVVCIALAWLIGRQVLGTVYQRAEIRGPSSVRSNDSARYELQLHGYVGQISWHVVDGGHLRELESHSRSVELQALMPGDYLLICTTSNLMGHRVHSRSFQIQRGDYGPHPGPTPVPGPCCQFDQLTRITSEHVAQIRSSRRSSQAHALANALKLISDRVSRSEITNEQVILNEIGAAYKAHTDNAWTDTRRAINDEVKRIVAANQIGHIREWASVIMAVVDGLQAVGDAG